MLTENLPNTEICPQNLGGTERQLRNADLTMTYWIMAAGFATSVVVFFTEVYNLDRSPFHDVKYNTKNNLRVSIHRCSSNAQIFGWDFVANSVVK